MPEGSHPGAGVEPADLLRQSPLFKGLSSEEAGLLAQSTRVQSYHPGQVIVSEGRVGAAFFIIVSGRVEVFKGRDDADIVSLATLGPGEFFGEIATMKHVPRSATVRALEETTCLVIWRVDFDSYIRQFPNVAARLEAELRSRFGEGENLEGLH